MTLILYDRTINQAIESIHFLIIKVVVPNRFTLNIELVDPVLSSV